MTKGKIEPRHTVFEWTCDECGRDHIGRMIAAEMSDEDAADCRERYGVDPRFEGEWLMCPTSVKCPDCGAEFDTGETE